MSSGYLATLSFGQRQIRFLELLRPGQSSFAMPLIIDIEGPCDERALQQALQSVIDRHDVLRASFPLVDGSPVQAVRDSLILAMPQVDVETSVSESWRDHLLTTADELAAQAFDLAAGPLIRARLLRASDQRRGIVIVVHHILADAASLDILARDLVSTYAAAQADHAAQTGDLPLQFTDFADWEQESFGQADTPELDAAIAYWRTQLRNAPPLLDLPFDRARRTDGETASAHRSLTLRGPIAENLTAVARQSGATPLMAFLAVWIAVLRRWSGLDDMVVTIPISKRTRPELTDLIGLFVDTLPIRTFIDSETTFADLLGQVRQAVLEAMEHRDLPFERIVQAIGIERRSDVIPLMQVLFGAHQGQIDLPETADGCRFDVLSDSVEQAAKADLSMVYSPAPDALELWCRYDAMLFDASTVEALLHWYGRIATAVGDQPDIAVDAIPLVDKAEGKDLVARFNATQRPYPRDRSAIDLFFEVAAASPDAIAIREDGVRLSYGDTAIEVRRLAAVLASEGVGKGDPVILAMTLSASCIQLMLAVLTLGAVFAPIDPHYPKARRDELARSIEARFAIVHADGLDLAADTVLLVEDVQARAASAKPHGGSPVDATDPAYIMFTSGSTGVPKGVAVPHRAIVRLVRNTDFCDFGPQTRGAAYSNPSFDASTLEVWAPLLNGGTVVPVDRTVVMDARSLGDFLSANDINLIWMTAGLFQQIVAVDPAVFAGDRTLIAGGDVVSPAAARAVLEAGEGTGFRLLNGYGPTENTVFSTVYDIGALEETATTIPIGRPIANSTAYVLDASGQPAPVGVVGEVYVGGDGVALGYIGDPERTASSFPLDPFSTEPGARMYRTGDLGRWRSDGVIQFFGRADNQVKVRGFRIELNEIATALSRHADIGAATVTAPRMASGARQLVAYVVAKNGHALDQTALRGYLQTQLPPHMLPHAYVVMDALPLTINGKIDVKALPPVEQQHFDRADTVTAPRTHEEQRLSAIWQDLLGQTGIGVHDNFFQVGGDSILAIRMVARAFDAGMSISLKDVFEHQTIESLAAAAVSQRQQSAPRGGDQFFAMDLLPQAGDETVPFALASVVLDHAIGSVELGYAVQRLAERHEGLRLRVVADGVTRRLTVDDFLPIIPVRVVDVPGLEDGNIGAWIDDHRERLGRGLDLTAGVTITATLVNRPPNLGPVVAIALHDAVADDRALAVLAAELEAELQSGLAPRMKPGESPTLKDWLNWLRGHAASKAVRDSATAVESWSGDLGAPAFLDSHDVGDVRAEIWLNPSLTRALTSTMPARLDISPLDPILASLGAALGGDERGNGLVIEMIDGGRALPPDAPRPENMLGNLETVLPIRLGPSPEDEAERLIAAKAARQAVQPMGPVYRGVRSTFDLPAAPIGLAWRPPQRAEGPLRLHQMPGFSASVRGALIAGIVDGRLRLQWTGARVSQDAQRLLQQIADDLAAFAAWAGEARAALRTPFDFPLARIDADTLQRLIDRESDFQDIYQLSPMQEAMLVHSLSATGSEVNFEQSCTRFTGNLDIAAFQRAWTYVFDRHPVLRTTFRWRGLDRPLQIVRGHVPAPLTIEHWDSFSETSLEARLADDRATGFDLEAGPLARMTLIVTASDDAYLMASFHHLLVDGWCLSQLEWEVRAAYEAFRRGTPPMLEAVAPYRDYIAWLAQVDRGAMRRYFAGSLNHAPDQPPIRQVEPRRGFVTARRVLDRATSQSLNGLARRRGVTIGAMTHLAWGLWSAARRGQSDTVFCTTVSGRPPTIAGVEQMVGLFINNLPLRLRFGDHTPLSDLAAGIQQQLGDLQSHAYISPLEVLDAAGATDRAAGLFDTLMVVENVPSGTSAWAGAPDLTVESIHGTLKTAYALTFVVVPGEEIALSLVLPDADGGAGEEGDAILEGIAAILTALPQTFDGVVADLPLPAPGHAEVASTAHAGRVSGSLVERPRSTLEALVAEAVAAMVDGSIRLDDDFASLGLTSLGIASLAARLSARLGHPVPVTLMLEHRTVAALAAALNKGQTWDAVVPMSGGKGEPFVCVHPIAGEVSAFMDLARAMPGEIPLWALQAPGLEEGQVPIDTVEGLASANLEALSRRDLPSPRWLGGYSFGGIVAFEMARQLTAAGRDPGQVIIIDTPAPLDHKSILSDDENRAHAEWLLRMADVRARYHGTDVPFDLDDLLGRDQAGRLSFAAERLQGSGLLPQDADTGWLTRAHATGLTLYRAFLDYAPDRSVARDVAVLLIKASHQADGDLDDVDVRWRDDPTLGWSQFIDAAIDITIVEGDHVSILAGDKAAAVAQAIAASIVGTHAAAQ